MGGGGRVGTRAKDGTLPNEGGLIVDLIRYLGTAQKLRGTSSLIAYGGMAKPPQTMKPPNSGAGGSTV
eukprot:2193416-Prymnesium_polylepis.1